MWWTSIAITEVNFQQAKCSSIPRITIKQNNNAPNEFALIVVETAQSIHQKSEHALGA